MGETTPPPGETAFRGYRLTPVYLGITDAERAVTNGTRDVLRGFPHPGADPAGMLIVTENRKLMRPGLKRLLERHGYEYRGRERRGLDVWLARF